VYRFVRVTGHGSRDAARNLEVTSWFLGIGSKEEMQEEDIDWSCVFAVWLTWHVYYSRVSVYPCMCHTLIFKKGDIVDYLEWPKLHKLHFGLYFSCLEWLKLESSHLLHRLTVAGTSLQKINTLRRSWSVSRCLFLNFGAIFCFEWVKFCGVEGAGLVLWQKSLRCFFWVLPKRSIPQPDQHGKDIILRELLSTDML